MTRKLAAVLTWFGIALLPSLAISIFVYSPNLPTDTGALMGFLTGCLFGIMGGRVGLQIWRGNKHAR